MALITAAANVSSTQKEFKAEYNLTQCNNRTSFLPLFFSFRQYACRDNVYFIARKTWGNMMNMKQMLPSRIPVPLSVHIQHLRLTRGVGSLALICVLTIFCVAEFDGLTDYTAEV